MIVLFYFSRGPKPGVLNRGYIYPLGVHFTYPGDKLNDAVVRLSTALVSKQKTRRKFYVRKLGRGKREKKG